MTTYLVTIPNFTQKTTATPVGVCNIPDFSLQSYTTKTPMVIGVYDNVGVVFCAAKSGFVMFLGMNNSQAVAGSSIPSAGQRWPRGINSNG